MTHNDPKDVKDYRRTDANLDHEAYLRYSLILRLPLTNINKHHRIEVARMVPTITEMSGRRLLFFLSVVGVK